MPPGSTLSLPVAQDVDLPRVVCSYGYFLLAPNRWVPQTQTLERSFRLAGRVVRTATTQPAGPGNPLRIRCSTKLQRPHQAQLKQQLTRMLRLDEDFTRWHRAYPDAKRRGFGRIFRSPSLFEDMVKTITGCNVTWRNTITMNRLLTQHVGRGAFPTPRQLSKWSEADLKQTCRVGYRAQRIIRLAQRFLAGDLDPSAFEDARLTDETVYQNLLALEGFGPYAASNMMQLLGRYDHLPIDTETYRHFRKFHGATRQDNLKALDARIEAYYEPYRPYRFLAYWFELWRDYEQREGDAWTWERDTTGQQFTAAVLEKQT